MLSLAQPCLKIAKPQLQQPGLSERLVDRTPLGRLGQPEDLIGTAVFLAAPASAYLTGQIIYVDGGYSAW